MSDEQEFGLTVDAHLDNLQIVRSYIDQRGAQLGVSESALADLRLVVDEAVTNVVIHGYRKLGGMVEIQMEAEGDSVIIRIRDRAERFDPSHVNTHPNWIPHSKTAHSAVWEYS